jgi:hypothetical protein
MGRRNKKARGSVIAPVARPEDKKIVPVSMQKSVAGGRSYEDIDVEKMIRRQRALINRTERQRTGTAFQPPMTYGSPGPGGQGNLKSFFVDPLALESNYYGTVRTISPWYGRQISCRILRRVSEKGWILNLCIQHIIKRVRPFLKPTTEENEHGFKIKNIAAAEKKRDMTAAEKEEAKALEKFFLKTGDVKDDNREDDLDKYITKILRDLYQLDQIATELQRTRGGELCAFWAVDAATIEVALPESEQITGIKYAQVINHLPYAYYGRDEFIFDCMNPRTDIEKAGYGYSIVEQAIDLVTSSINTFMYNAGFFTENKLPRGILLLNGDADTEEIEDIEDYIVNLMSGPPTSQWRVPIIPSGKDKNGDSGGRRFEWVSLQGTNKEMEFQTWFDLQISAIVSMFALSMEELGLHSQKSQALFAADTKPKMEASKSLNLSDVLAYIQKTLNRILAYKNPAYEFEFVGYEKDDPTITANIDREEVGTFKTLNEKRAEKGNEPIDFTKIKNPADLPMNPQAVQLWQSLQQGGGMGGSPFGDMGDIGEGGTDESGGDFGSELDPDGEGGEEPQGEAPGGDGWGELEAQHGEGETIKKSIAGQRSVVRILI